MIKYDPQGALSQLWTDLYPENKVDWDDLSAEDWLEMYEQFRKDNGVDDVHKYRLACEEHMHLIHRLESKLAEYDAVVAAELDLRSKGVSQDQIDLLKRSK